MTNHTSRPIRSVDSEYKVQVENESPTQMAHLQLQMSSEKKELAPFPFEPRNEENNHEWVLKKDWLEYQLKRAGESKLILPERDLQLWAAYKINTGIYGNTKKQIDAHMTELVGGLLKVLRRTAIDLEIAQEALKKEKMNSMNMEGLYEDVIEPIYKEKGSSWIAKTLRKKKSVQKAKGVRLTWPEASIIHKAIKRIEFEDEEEEREY